MNISEWIADHECVALPEIDVALRFMVATILSTENDILLNGICP